MLLDEMQLLTDVPKVYWRDGGLYHCHNRSSLINIGL